MMSFWFHMQAIWWTIGFGIFCIVMGMIFTYGHVTNGIRELNYLSEKIDHTWGSLLGLQTNLNAAFMAPECFSLFDMSTFHIHCPHEQSRNISSVLWGHFSCASPINEGITHRRSCLDEIQDVICCVTLTHFLDQKIGKLMSTLI